MAPNAEGVVVPPYETDGLPSVGETSEGLVGDPHLFVGEKSEGDGRPTEDDLKGPPPSYAETLPEHAVVPPQAEQESSKPAKGRQGGTPMRAEVMYKPAARIIQDPTLPLSQRPCKAKEIRTRSSAGSNLTPLLTYRRDLITIKNACSRRWNPDPEGTNSLVTHQWKHRSKFPANQQVEEWKVFEEKDKERRDHELALELGYETLVGNLLYIDIPGGRDINRSWQNFLSQDPLEWGFPYEKGTTERPRMKQPEPYLAHQMKEKLWRYPKTKIFQSSQEDSSSG